MMSKEFINIMRLSNVYAQVEPRLDLDLEHVFELKIGNYKFEQLSSYEICQFFI